MDNVTRLPVNNTLELKVLEIEIMRQVLTVAASNTETNAGFSLNQLRNFKALLDRTNSLMPGRPPEPAGPVTDVQGPTAEQAAAIQANRQKWSDDLTAYYEQVINFPMTEGEREFLKVQLASFNRFNAAPSIITAVLGLADKVGA